MDTRALKIRELFTRSIEVKKASIETACETLGAMAEICVTSLKAGGKILLCGNGGSAADAQHLAAELLVRLRPNVNRQPIAAIALALDTSSYTACGNDYSFEDYFSRMTQALGRADDVLIAITTSGKSSNIIKALQTAHTMKMKTLGFLGCGGGAALQHCDLALVVPSTTETGRIQEVHITAGHALMELIEDSLIGA